MKILLINTFYHPNFVGGAERVTQTLAEALAGNGHEVHVLCLGEDSKAVTREVNGVAVSYLPCRNLFWIFGTTRRSLAARAAWHAVDTYNWMMASQIGRLLDTERPEIVHTNSLIGFSAAVWREVKTRGISCVHTIHDYYLLCHRQVMYRKFTNCAQICKGCVPFSILRRRLSSQIDAVVGVSKAVLARHLELGFFEGTPERHVIYNATASGHQTAEKTSRPKRLRLGFLGRLQVTKGIETLLCASRSMKGSAVDILVGGKGDPSYESHLREQYREPNVRYLGFVDPSAFFKMIDVLVVPSSWYDPLPTVILEAFAHGIPVIGSARGGIPELVDHGVTGLLFDPSDASQLPSAISTLLENPGLLDSMSASALKRARRFEPANLYAAYLDIYEKLRGGVRRSRASAHGVMREGGTSSG